MSESNLLKISEVIPHEYVGVFPYETFNTMQSILFEQVFHTSLNIVVAAPTGSGKTVIHELAILRQMLKAEDLKRMRCVFIAPNKALCQDKVARWKDIFSICNLRVLELTGDTSLSQSLQLIVTSNVIVTTPEKWDSLTRSWRDHVYLLGAVDLLLLDEIHHIGEERGSTLEALVVRMRILNSAYINAAEKRSNGIPCRTRVVALSATLPNISEIGEWLQCSPEATHYFDESFRPVPLTVHVAAYSNCRNPFLFEKNLDSKVLDIIQRFSDGRQTLIFCSSKKGTEALCSHLSKFMKLPFLENRLIAAIVDPTLRYLARSGFGYHHAGLCLEDRSIVEKLFLAGSIQVLCTTSTLAHGVNLPAHLVIIKGTNMWRGKGYMKLPRSMVIQMTGRAGRPNFDSSGVAVIMTSHEDRAFYENRQMELVESALHNNFSEVLCSEITQGVIQDLSDAITWLKMTFFYIRLQKNAGYYLGHDTEPQCRDSVSLPSFLCTSTINALAKAQLVEYDTESFLIRPLPEAYHMNRHSIKCKTMMAMMKLDENCDMSQNYFSQVQETQKILRRYEKKALNNLMRTVRFSCKSKVSTTELKSFVLIQAAVERKFIQDFSMRLEMADIVEQAVRVLGALKEHSIERRKGKLLENCVYFSRALMSRQWENASHCYYAQFDDISDSLKKMMHQQNIVEWSDMELSDAADVMSTFLCNSRDANNLLEHAAIAKSSALSVSASIDMSSICISISRIFPTTTSVDLPTSELVCYDAVSGELLCYRKIHNYTNFMTVSVPLSPQVLKIKISAINTVTGLDHSQIIRCDHPESPLPIESNAELIDSKYSAAQDALVSLKKSKVSFEKIKPYSKKNLKLKVPTPSDCDGYRYESMLECMVVEDCERKATRNESDNCHQEQPQQTVEKKTQKIFSAEIQFLRGKASEILMRNSLSTEQKIGKISKVVSAKKMNYQSQKRATSTTSQPNSLDSEVPFFEDDHYEISNDENIDTNQNLFVKRRKISTIEYMPPETKTGQVSGSSFPRCVPSEGLPQNLMHLLYEVYVSKLSNCQGQKKIKKEYRDFSPGTICNSTVVANFDHAFF